MVNASVRSLKQPLNGCDWASYKMRLGYSKMSLIKRVMCMERKCKVANKTCNLEIMSKANMANGL